MLGQILQYSSKTNYLIGNALQQRITNLSDGVHGSK